MQFQNSYHSRFSLSSTSNPYIPTTFCSLLSEEGNLHFSHVLENGLLGKQLVFTHKNSKLKILYRYFCLSKTTGNVHIDYHSTSWVLDMRQAMHPASSSPGNAMPRAGLDVLVVMCIGGGITQEVTALQISTR